MGNTRLNLKEFLTSGLPETFKMPKVVMGFQKEKSCVAVPKQAMISREEGSERDPDWERSLSKRKDMRDCLEKGISSLQEKGLSKLTSINGFNGTE